MHSILSLLSWIFFGEFGLLTLTPRYLFGVLFPVMIFVGLLSALLGRFRHGNLLYIVTGLGCTTAALAASSDIQDDVFRRRILWLLILLIPCSSQIAIIAAFAAMVTLRVFLTYLLFVALFSAVIYLCIAKLYPSSAPRLPAAQARAPFRLSHIIKEAFLSVTSTVPSFCAGSVCISILMYCGLMDQLSRIFAPWLMRLLRLPKEAASLFILNLFKRDFGSASLLNIAADGSFDAVQMVVVMIMLTFCVPCFNTTVLLYKQEKLPMASFIWLGSLFISLFFGRLVSTVLFVCTL